MDKAIPLGSWSLNSTFHHITAYNAAYSVAKQINTVQILETTAQMSCRQNNARPI